MNNKNIYTSLLIVFLCFSGFINAQNSYKAFSSDSTQFQTIEVSEGLNIKEIATGSEREKCFALYPEINNHPSSTRNNHKFTLHIEGHWTLGFLGNGEGFLDILVYDYLENSTYEAYLPEGYYDIVIEGFTTENYYYPAFICLEQIFVDRDIEMTANMADAVYKIEIAPVDKNGNLLDNLNNCDRKLNLVFLMHPSIRAYFLTGITYLKDPFSSFYFFVNDMGDRNRIKITADAYDIENQNSYYVSFPTIENGVTEDVALTNKSDEMVHYTQLFNISKELTSDSYSHISHDLVIYDNEKGHIALSRRMWSKFRVQDREKPISLYIYAPFKDNPQTGDINAFCSPIFYESYIPSSGCGDESEIIVPFPMAVNKNGELIMDYFSKFISTSFKTPGSLLETICNNSLSRVYNKDEFYNEGYRTPHLYHQSANFTAEQLPGYGPVIMGGLLFLGEFGEQKYNHGNVKVGVKGDGISIFDGSIFDFNGAFMNTAFTHYQVNITNDEVFAYGRKMTNHTVIDFDFTNPDVNPPTLTMLRVLDNEKISMSVENAGTARLEITAGDHIMEWDDIAGWNDIAYDKKITLEVLWSTDGEVFYEFPIEEDESKFHPGYGFFFNVSLAPLSEHCAGNSWIIVKTILTDEAGNSQVQTFDPLFYYGYPIAIDEIPFEQANSIAYPNPFTGKVNIELQNPVSGEVYLEIYDISGRIIHQQKYNCDHTTSFTWNGSHQKEGIYFYGIYSKEGAVRGKIVKE